MALVYERGTRYAVRGTIITVALLSSSLLHAQTGLADSLWGAGNYRAARAEYLRVLHDDPGSVRSLYRLAILNAWDGRLDSALALLRDAREIQPREPDVRLWEAKTLAWKGEYREAMVRYDSVIAEFPERPDMRIERAQTLAWSGHEREADAEYRAVIAANPENADALFALAQLRLWQEQLEEADHYNRLALSVAPHNRTGRELQRQIIALRHPRLELTLGVTHDSDRNTAWWQTLETSLVLGPGIRTFASVEAYEASDPIRSGRRITGEVGANWNHGNLGLLAGLGIRNLNSDFGVDRSLGTVRLGAHYRLSPGSGIGVSYAHYSFDETAFLLGSDLNVSEFSVDGDVDLRRGLSLGVGAGTAGFSDDNHRKSLVAALTQSIGGGLSAGLYGRGLWYNSQGNGYFSPDHYLIGEIRAIYKRAFRPWETRLSAGIGLQDVGIGGANQTDARWHAEARLARRWATINEIAFSGGISTNSISSATGAYRYYTATLSARIGL